VRKDSPLQRQSRTRASLAVNPYFSAKRASFFLCISEEGECSFSVCVKISGTITLTGGKLDFTVCESEQLDIRGLTLIKQHPSPDMVKIRYELSAGLNTGLLQAKAGKGTIKFTLGESAYDITIW